MAKPTCQDLLSLLLLLLCFCQLGSCFEPYNSPLNYDCDPVRTAITNRQLKYNTDQLMAQLVAKVALTRFATAGYGSGQSAIYGLLQCRADVSAKQCAACATKAWTKLNSTCAKDGRARIWFERCYLRYDTQNFIGKLDRMDDMRIWNNAPAVPNAEVYVEKVGKLLRELSAMAVVPGQNALGAGETMITANLTIYGMAQCTRDLAPSLCSSCLNSTVTQFRPFIFTERGMALLGSCQIRFESYPFISKT